MNWLIDRLVMRIADVLDRSLITVPELDDDWPRASWINRGNPLSTTRECLRSS